MSWSCSLDAPICVYDDAGNVIETHEHKGEFNSERHGVKQKAAMRGSTTVNCFGWLTASAIIHDGLRCGLAHFKLCAHFL